MRETDCGGNWFLFWWMGPCSVTLVTVIFCWWTGLHSLPVVWPEIKLWSKKYATGEQWRNNYRKNEEAEPKWEKHSVVDVAGDGSKVWFCKEQYCIGIWIVMFMNQGNIEAVKQQMARMNIYVLGITELKMDWNWWI